MYTVERKSSQDLDRIAIKDDARLCFACSICVGDCPAAKFSDDFNPRQIFLKVSLGIEEGLVGKDSPIWKCTTCYTCYERCPAGTKPLDVILALRNLSLERGDCPESVESVRKSVLKQGIATAVTDHVKKLRGEMNLPDVDDGDKPELEKLTGED